MPLRHRCHQYVTVGVATTRRLRARGIHTGPPRRGSSLRRAMLGRRYRCERTNRKSIPPTGDGCRAPAGCRRRTMGARPSFAWAYRRMRAMAANLAMVASPETLLSLDAVDDGDVAGHRPHRSPAGHRHPYRARHDPRHPLVDIGRVRDRRRGRRGTATPLPRGTIPRKDRPSAVLGGRWGLPPPRLPDGASWACVAPRRPRESERAAPYGDGAWAIRRKWS